MKLEIGLDTFHLYFLMHPPLSLSTYTDPAQLGNRGQGGVEGGRRVGSESFFLRFPFCLDASWAILSTKGYGTFQVALPIQLGFRESSPPASSALGMEMSSYCCWARDTTLYCDGCSKSCPLFCKYFLN